MHAKYKVSISSGSKVSAKVKVDNRQAHRQDKKVYPGHSTGGINNQQVLFIFFTEHNEPANKTYAQKLVTISSTSVSKHFHFRFEFERKCYDMCLANVSSCSKVIQN